VFRQGNDHLTIKGLGFEFDGYSGEVVMWLLTFITLALVLDKLWA